MNEVELVHYNSSELLKDPENKCIIVEDDQFGDLNYRYHNGCYIQDSKHKYLKKSIFDQVSKFEKSKNYDLLDDDYREKLESKADAVRNLRKKIFNSYIELSEFVDESECYQNLREINAKNCIVDHESRKQRPHDPSEYNLMQTNANYIQGSVFPENFSAMLARMIYSDGNLKSNETQNRVNTYIAILALMLIGENNHRHIYFIIGDSGTGKSTLFEFMRYMLGGYCGYVHPDTFRLKPNNGNGLYRPGLPEVRHCFCLIISELTRTAVWDSPLVKSLVSGETQSHKSDKGKIVTYKPKMKIYVLTNFSGKLDIKEDGIPNRVKMLDHKNPISKEDTIDGFIDSLMEQDYMDKVFSHLCDLCHEYYNTGKQILFDHSFELDKQYYLFKLREPIEAFFESMIIPLDVNQRELNDKQLTVQEKKWDSNDLKSIFDNFCEKHGFEEEITLTKFGRKFFELSNKKKCIERHKVGSRPVYYSGLGIRGINDFVRPERSKNGTSGIYNHIPQNRSNF